MYENGGGYVLLASYSIYHVGAPPQTVIVRENTNSLVSCEIQEFV
jgi:hypothetical protein